MRHAFNHHHPHDRPRDAEARAILRDPHALVVVDEAMDTDARASSWSRSVWTSGSAESRDGKQMNSSQVRPQRPCAVRWRSRTSVFNRCNGVCSLPKRSWRES
jgi:hypothetical protein